MQQKGVKVRHCPIPFSFSILEHQIIYKLRWMGEGKAVPKLQVEFTLFSLHIPLQALLPRKFSIRKMMLEGDQLTSGAGHWDSSLLYWSAHALIQPRWGKLCNREVLKLAEPSSWGKMGCIPWCRGVSLHFLGLIWLGKETVKKNQGHFFPHGIL